MKIIHLSDLHIGKRVNEISMIEEQKHMLEQILDMIQKERIDAVIVAGDVFDKSSPSAESVEILDDFLAALAVRKIKCFIVSGNHDSAERIAYGGRIMKDSGIYLSPAYQGSIETITLEDEYGTIGFYLFPFIKPIHVRQFASEPVIESYQDAYLELTKDIKIDLGIRNVAISHQLFHWRGELPERSESESFSVGGLESIDISLLDGFDYVALGHIHKPQTVGRETARYCGSPLKYSFSEANHIKSAVIINLQEKGDISLDFIPIIPKRDMREIKGPLKQLISETTVRKANQQDYLHITLTDEDEIVDAIGKVRAVYPNVMRLDFENSRTRESEFPVLSESLSYQTPNQVFAEFYQMQNGAAMDEEKGRVVDEIFESLRRRGDQ